MQDLIKPTTVQIVCYERGWILEAIAEQWLSSLTCDANVSECTLVYGSPDPGYDVYIHFIWFDAAPVSGARNIMYVTHLDHWWKAIKVIDLARKGSEFVCMSSQTKSLINKYVASECTQFILQESIHFGRLTNSDRKPLIFGMFFRLQIDGRKSISEIVRVLKFANDNADCCQLILFGDGFSELVSPYDKIVASVYSGDFDRVNYETQLKRCDYLLYFGFDEGAISILDAATLNIPVFVTKQGYHLDLMLAKGSLLFDSARDVSDTVISSSLAWKAKGQAMTPRAVLNNSTLIYRKPSLIQYIKIFFVENIFITNTKHLKQDIKVILKMLFGKP